jgi:ribose 1,5-bisphosphokinase
MDDDLRVGRAVICNVSRSIIAPARERYVWVRAVLVTAPAGILARRLALRAREDEHAITDRLQRTETISSTFTADYVIDNVGAPENGTRRLLNAILGPSRSDLRHIVRIPLSTRL